jgi:Fur family ferric uptake transcriptional regulator
MQNTELTDKAFADFAVYLKRNRLKMTRERRIILRELFSDDSHMDAEDLQHRFSKRGKKVSRATIYRTFELLLQAGLIKKSDFGHNHYHYEKRFGGEHHDHLVCTRCGAVFEFHNQELERIQEEVCRRRGFRMTSHSLQIFGLCRKCGTKSD